MYHRPGRAVPVVASAAVRHGAPASDDGYVGSVVKTRTPAQDAVRADLDLVAAGEGYNLVVTGIIEVPLAGLEAAVKGQLIYIANATNALGLAPGAGISVLGKLWTLAGEQGGGTAKVRVNLNEKA